MLNSLSKHIAVFLLSQNCFEKEMLPIYTYGIELLLSSLLGVILVLAAGVVLGAFQQSVLFLIAFIFLRLFTGGLHCNSYVKCNATMLITFAAVVITQRLLTSTSIGSPIICTMMIVSIAVTAIFAPVGNPNKPIPQSEKQKFRLISLCMLIAHFLIHIFLHRYISTEVIVITDFISSAYIIIGLLKNKTERRFSDESQKEHC